MLLAFFGLGVVTGLSGPGRLSGARARALFDGYRQDMLSLLVPLGPRAAAGSWQARGERAGGEAVAMVERPDGLYALSAEGELSGPLSPGLAADLPVLSGAAVELGRPGQLLRYATLAVRAEAELSEMISEMRVGAQGEIALFLERSRTEIDLDTNGAALELTRAGEVLRRFRGRESAIALVDMTTPDQAVVRLREAAPAARVSRAGVDRVVAAARGEQGETRASNRPAGGHVAR